MTSFYNQYIDTVMKNDARTSSSLDAVMGAYRANYRANDSKVLTVLAEHLEMDFVRFAKKLTITENSIWRAKDIGFLVCEKATSGNKWIVKNAEISKY